MNIPNLTNISLLFLSFLLYVGGADHLCAQPGIEWNKTYGGDRWEELQAMSYTNDNGYLLAGKTTTIDIINEVEIPGLGDGFADAWVFKIDESGNKIWESRFGCDENETIWDIYPEEDGTFLLLAESASNACATKTEPSRGGADFWLIKIDSQGNKLWDRTYGGDANDIGRKIVKTDDGNFLLGGISWSGNSGERTSASRGEADYWVVKVNPDGDYIEDYVFGSNSNDFLYDMVKHIDGTILIGGWSESDAGFEKSMNSYGRNDFWLIHTDQNGNKIGTGDYSYGGNYVDVLQEITITNDGNILLVGESFSDPFSSSGIGNKTSPHYGATDADEDFWVVKLNSDFSINWQKTYGGDKQDFAHAALESISGRLLIVGDSTSPISGNKTSESIEDSKDIWMILLEADGTKIWEKTFGGTGYEAPEEILLAHDGGYIIGSHSNSDMGYDKSENSRGFNDFWALKTGCAIDQIETNVQIDICEGEPFYLDNPFPDCIGCSQTWIDYGDTVELVFLAENTELDLIVTDTTGCEIVSTFSFVIRPNPQFLEIEVSPPTCFEDNDASISVLEIINGTEPFLYSFNGSEFNTTNQFQNLTFGNYLITVQDSFECLVDTLIEFPSQNIPLIDIGEDTIIELGDSIFIDVITSIGVDTFIWSQPELLACAYCPTTSTQPTETTLYSITGISETGCEVSDNLLIAVKLDYPYYAPSAFSPNLDGNNDYFTIFPGNGVEEIRNLQIFNRWGEQMFLANNPRPQDTGEGWNGIYRGQPAATGVYIWTAEIEFIDGRIEQIWGDVTLMK